MTLSESYARCEALAHSHYENFPVARLVPKRLRGPVAAVYAFARTADDIADEGYGLAENTPDSRREALSRFDAQVLACAAGEPLDPETEWIFLALGDTLRRHSIPARLCLDLTSAFTQDIDKRSYADFDELLDYCRRSANPVGRIVLLLHGYTCEVRMRESDAICTGLQLANFWQDVAVDWKKDRRVYLPREDFEKFGCAPADLAAPSASPAVRALIAFNTGRAAKFFDAGEALPGRLAFPLSLEIRLTVLGGRAILKKIREMDHDTLRARPKLGRRDKITLLLRGLFPL